MKKKVKTIRTLYNMSNRLCNIQCSQRYNTYQLLQVICNIISYFHN